VKIEIEQGDSRIDAELRDGAFTLGGGEGDAVRVPGLPPALLRLWIHGDRLRIEPRETVPVAGLLSPAGVARLLLPGKWVEVSEHTRLRQAPAQEDSTSEPTDAMVRQMLVDTHSGPYGIEVVCLTGLDSGRRYPVADGPNAIGRGEDVVVPVRDRAVSRRHACLTLGKEGCSLEDLGTPNGTFLNGEPVEGRSAVYAGDVIEMGRTLLEVRGKAARESGAGGAELPDTARRGRPGARHQWAQWVALGTGASIAILGALATWHLVP
jgi:hypothetical protein